MTMLPDRRRQHLFQAKAREAMQDKKFDAHDAFMAWYRGVWQQTHWYEEQPAILERMEAAFTAGLVTQATWDHLQERKA